MTLCRFRPFPALVIMAMCLLGGCADEQIRANARRQIANGDYEQGLRTLEESTKDRPDSLVLRSEWVQARVQVMAKLVSEADQDRVAGRLEEAQEALTRAQKLDPKDRRIAGLLNDLLVEHQQASALKKAQDLVASKQPGAALETIEQAMKGNPRHAGLLQLKRQLESAQRQAQWTAARQSLIETRPISLDFRDANLRAVLDLVSRNSGINFIFDKDVRTDVRITVYVNQAKVEDALDLIASTNQLAKKVVDSKTIIIYPNTAEKQREYQEQVLRVFYLTSSEAKGAALFLKSMLKLREPFVDDRSNLLALRDSKENIELAERLISLYDSGEPEVLLEVEVMEVNTTRLTELGIKYPDTFSLTPLAPSNASRLTLGNLNGIGADRIGVSVAGLIFNLRKEVGDATTLANPKIRVRNKEKAKILIGDKIPVVTTTSSNSGFVSESINYLDVGLKLDVEPTIYTNDEIALGIALEVSSLGSATKTASGAIAYQIGTRNASTLLRLRDGETQLLAGLISRSESTSASRIPGIGDMPLLGRLFGNQQDSSSKTELVLAITPRILQNIRHPDASEAEMWIGTEAAPKLRPWGGLRASGEPGGASGNATRPDASSANGSAVGAGPARVEPAPQSGEVNPIELRWSGPTEVHVGDVVDVQLVLNSLTLLRGMPLTLALAPGVLTLTDVVEGGYFRKDGMASNFVKSLTADASSLSVGMLRNTATGTNGEGTTLTLRFKATATGLARLSVASAQALSVNGPADALKLPAPWEITVK